MPARKRLHQKLGSMTQRTQRTFILGSTTPARNPIHQKLGSMTYRGLPNSEVLIRRPRPAREH
eukprot:2318756-Alexandrium_andersonii.AAC.1